MTDCTPAQARAHALRIEDMHAVGKSTGATADALRALADQVEALTAERDALKVDAARYLWLRSGGYTFIVARTILNDTPHGIDVAIDKAMKEPK